MSEQFSSKYPAILTDTVCNSPLENMSMLLTTEQYYDLLHHTHKVEDLDGDISSEKIYTDEEIRAMLNEELRNGGE